MPATHKSKTLHFPPELHDDIEAAAGERQFTAWVLDACQAKLRAVAARLAAAKSGS